MIRQNLVNVILTGHENKFLVKNSTKYHYKMRLKCKPLQYEGTFTFGRISSKKGFVFAHSILYCPFLNSNLNRTFANMSHMEEKLPPVNPQLACTVYSVHHIVLTDTLDLYLAHTRWDGTSPKSLFHMISCSTANLSILCVNSGNTFCWFHWLRVIRYGGVQFANASTSVKTALSPRALLLFLRMGILCTYFIKHRNLKLRAVLSQSIDVYCPA